MTVFGYTSEQKKDFLKFMRRACGGENGCYYIAEEGLEADNTGDSVIYFSCQFQFVGGGYRHDVFGKCLSIGGKGYEKFLRKFGRTELAERYRKQIGYCEEQYGKRNYYKQFSCLQDFIKDNKGKYAK